MSGVESMRVRLSEHMRENGLKHTQQRDAILSVFVSLGGHVSVDELLRSVQQTMSGVGHATVYRSLKLFVEAGVAHERHFQDGQTRYEVLSPDEHHDHLICSTCGRIFEFEDPVIEVRQTQVAAAHGLRLTSHRHEIYGVCMAPDGCPHRPPVD